MQRGRRPADASGSPAPLPGARAQVLAILISRKLPKVYAQIQRFQTPTSLITMAWSLTGYLSVFPFEV